MALNVKKIAMPQNKYSIKCPYIMDPTRIVIHNTANDASAENEIKYMQSNNNQVSFHYAVDDKQAVQGVDLWRNAWHAGDGVNGKGNREGIAIEICYSKSGGARFEKAEKNAAELAAQLLINFGWGIDKITKHQDYPTIPKYCPHRTLDMGWDRFIKMVEDKREELLGKKKQTVDLTKSELNGYTIERAKDFSIIYWDKSKKKGTKFGSYINGGFFGYYKEGTLSFTLPVGNLVCDVTSDSTLKYAVRKYWDPYISQGKFQYSTNDNVSPQFKGKKISTLILPRNGSPYVDEVSAAPADTRYAISGIPVIRHGEDVSYNKFVLPQGWDSSPFYATSRNYIGLKGTSLWIVSGASKTSNFVATSEVYEKLKTFEFDDLLALDGGGSYYHKYDGKSSVSWSDRDVNNVVVFG